MVNATEMAKHFNKRPTDYLRTQSAIDFVYAISVMTKCLTDDLVRVTKGKFKHPKIGVFKI